MTISGRETIERRDPRTLQPHPLNAQLYGDERDAGLRADIAANGIREPLRITADGTIISGHSRCAIAVELDLSDVPVIVSSLDDPTEILAEMISSNNRRKKTYYVLAREYQQLKPIQAELALRRKLSGCGEDHRVNFPHGEKRKGRASDLAAVMLGMTGKTADRALHVVMAIDRARASGHDEDADLLTAHLNKSILRGYKSAHALGYLRKEQVNICMTPFNNCTWARWQWDPITGCQSTCSYCTARDQAVRNPAACIDRTAPCDEQERQLADPFAPRLHTWRLQAPLQARVSDGEEPAHYRVLTGWQGELFGPWVPREWIEQVMDTVHVSAHQGLPWQYLFLTKYPARLLEIDWPANAWVGVTVDSQECVRVAEETLRELKQRYPMMVTYLACEPLREELRFTSLAMCSWLFIGGQVRTATVPECQPPWHWVLSLMAQASRDGCGIAARPAMKLILPMTGPDTDETALPVDEAIRDAITPLLPQVTV